mmetsp:Transcript_45619/g.52719  ORF Transcript_45619/g.52719 Transcript_45619/m.52719 type:complete len:264 (+) Transcript_45619:1-792(+)
MLELGTRAVALGLINAPLQLPQKLIRNVSFLPYRDDAHQWKAVQHLEQHYPQIREEVLAIYKSGALAQSSYLDGAQLHIAGEWKELDIIKMGWVQPQALQILPITSKIVMSLVDGNSMVHGGSKISLMRPGTIVRPHTGQTNARLRIHLGIRIPQPDDYYIRVNNETRTWVEGKCIVIDDSFVHEVWHTGKTNMTRIVLIVDVWHPEMDETQRRESIRIDEDDEDDQRGQQNMELYNHHTKHPRQALRSLGVLEPMIPNHFVY